MNVMEIPIIKPIIDENGSYFTAASGVFEARMKNIITTGQLTNGEYVKEFEKEIASRMGARYGIAVNSCTIGLVLAIKALGAAGKEVILPSFTFNATALACVWNGCKLVFADIDDTLCMDPADVARKITPDTALILGVHMYGLPCKVIEFEELQERYGIPIIYDGAHALGASISTSACSGLCFYGDATVFSFSPTKLITTGEGGMVITNDLKLASTLYDSRNYGNHPSYGDYDCQEIGLSARMNEMSAALGLEQIGKLYSILARREKYRQMYIECLQDVPGIATQRIPVGYNSANKDFSIFVDPVIRTKLENHLKAAGVQVKRYFAPPLHKMEIFKEHMAKPVNLEITEKAAASVISLPIWNKMDNEPIIISNLIREIMKNEKD